MKRQPVPGPIQRAVFARDGLCCRYCAYKNQAHPEKFHVEHVVPVSKGGASTMQNLVVACERCNSLKGTAVWTPMSRYVCCPMRHPLEAHVVLKSQGMTASEADRKLRVRTARRKGRVAMKTQRPVAVGCFPTKKNPHP